MPSTERRLISDFTASHAQRATGENQGRRPAAPKERQPHRRMQKIEDLASRVIETDAGSTTTEGQTTIVYNRLGNTYI